MMIGNMSDIALSGLRAQSARLNVAANNVANMNTEDFKPSEASQMEDVNGGVNVTLSQSQNAGVDLAKEMTDMISTSAAFKANIKSLQVADEMVKNIIDIKV